MEDLRTEVGPGGVVCASVFDRAGRKRRVVEVGLPKWNHLKAQVVVLLGLSRPLRADVSRDAGVADLNERRRRRSRHVVTSIGSRGVLGVIKAPRSQQQPWGGDGGADGRRVVSHRCSSRSRTAAGRRCRRYAEMDELVQPAARRMIGRRTARKDLRRGGHQLLSRAGSAQLMSGGTCVGSL